MRNRLKKLIVEGLEARLGAQLRDAQFNARPPAWCWSRESRSRIDIVEILFADHEGRTPYGLTPASFGLQAGVFFRGIPHPMGASFEGLAGEPVSNVAGCHFVLQSLPGRWRQGLLNTGLWYVDRFGILARGAIAQASARIERQVIPWFDSFSDLHQAVQDADSRLSAGQLGRIRGESIRSPALVLGLLAASLGSWPLARKHLQAALIAKNPIREIDALASPWLFAAARPRIEAALREAGHQVEPNQT